MDRVIRDPSSNSIQVRYRHLRENTLGKSMNSTSISPAMGK